MKKREKVLQQAKKLLESANLTVDDLVQYCAEDEAKKKKTEVSDSVQEEATKAGTSVQKFSFEVMYEGMIRSWFPLEDKKPLGVIFENHLITLKDSSEGLNWHKAKDYCQSVKIDGHVCSAGEIGFWRKMVNSPEKLKEVLDNLLISLGGTVLKGKWRWSSSEYGNYRAWVFCTNFGVSPAGVDWYKKDGNYSNVVRPVLDLTGLSC